jgi:hypothetical protein
LSKAPHNVAELHGHSDLRILSRSFPVEWAGWETTTQRLQQAGWQIAYQYDFGSDRYRFLFKHDKIDLMGYADWTYIDKLVALAYGDRELPTIRVGHVAKQFFIEKIDRKVLDCERISPWTLTDARSQLCDEPVRSWEDFSVFAKLQPKEILIPRADMSVVEHLEAIIKAQEPKQHELRQTILKESRNVRQIASIAEVA